jgi:hypothetical protein
MKPALFLAVLVAGFQYALSEDVTFTNRTATFKDLQGRTYGHVQLVRGDLDGLIWRDGASGGRICYTNLSSEFLEGLGISSNRIEVARARAEKKAIADARYRSMVFAKPPQNKMPGQTETTNGPPISISEQEAAPVMDGSGIPIVPGYLYPPEFLYGFGVPGVAASAPSAGSYPTAAAAMSAASAQSTGYSPSATPATGAGLVPSAPSAPSAPPSFLPPTVPARRR